MDVFGYMTVYIKIETKELEESYFKVESDFRKPITRKILRNLLKAAKETIIEMGFTPTNVCYATKEEYENSDTEAVLAYNWNDA